MKPCGPSYRQRGATLIVGMIMLGVITLMVITAFTLSNTNLKSVGNMQFRNEAIAAANKATEQVVGSAFTTQTTTQSINVDLNNDGTVDYVVSVAPPVCIRASVGGAPVLSSVSLTNMSTTGYWNTIWDLDATVTDVVSSASVRVHSAIRVLRTDAQKNTECP
jgi:Tfp pilus assembly protein PilX